MFVKICGITRIEDAARAVELGTTAVGFVFWPQSPRFVDPYRARAIARQLPAFVLPIGVFVNQPADYVNAVSALVGLHAVQLHGDEPPEYVRGMTRPVIKAVAAASAIGGQDGSGWPASVTLLVDAADPVRRGGTGRTADWHAAATLARTRRIILAGGLSAGNVLEAISAVQPYGIDVSSAIEASAGVKDHARLTALFSVLKGAPSVKESERL